MEFLAMARCERRFLVGALAAFLAFAPASRAQDWDPFKPAEPGTQAPAAKDIVPGRPDPTSAASPLDKKIDQMVEYYAEMYSKHLKRPDWIARAMAVISLSRIDDPRTTESLVKVLSTDGHPAVRVFAWEALHARNRSLTPEQRRRWQDAGAKLADKGVMRGHLRAGLLGVMGSLAPSPPRRQVFMKFFATTNSLDPDDIPTLWAMRATLAKWRDPELIKSLILEMGKLDNAYRAEYVLGGLGSGVPHSATNVRLGSKAMWDLAQRAWADWFKQSRPAAAADRLAPYDGRSMLTPPPEKITDPGDPKWRKDLEVGRAYLDPLDVTFAVDSTGSMMQVVEWVKRDVLKMMRSFGAISREPRIGVVFYRDHGDEYVVRLHPLTHRGDQLEAAIRGATAKGGADVPEAVFEALDAAVGQQWSRGDRARKVVVLVGDAPPHENTADRIDKLIEAAVGKGFRFHCIKARTAYGGADLSSFDRIAERGKGRAFWVSFPAVSPTGTGRTGIAPARSAGDPHRQIVGEVLKSILTQAYHDRAETFVAVLLECLKDHVPEKRIAFGPAPPPQPRTRTERREPRQPRPPQPPPKPYDPQAR